MKNVYGYIRVSTKEQGKTASLPEQKSAIIEYAKKNQLNIVKWYEEEQTAAKRGRPFFTEMLNNLKERLAEGVIIHKIDRSARNLHDWAAVGDLTDIGIEVHFAHESLDMTERGGRLSADIQAVMASDYVRNLRQETIKGLYGRLKQGLYPWLAPVGYDDNGKGKLKTINPIYGPMIKEVFELYASGQYNVRELSKLMFDRGLRNKKGGVVCKNRIAKILKNTFYIRIIKIKDKEYHGKHEALIDSRLFHQAQLVLGDRSRKKHIKNNYLFRRLVRCGICGIIMTGETQKGRVYYRCHTKDCQTKTRREDLIERSFENTLKKLKFSKSETKVVETYLSQYSGLEHQLSLERKKSYQLKIDTLQSREGRLLEAYLDNLIDKEKYEESRKKTLYELTECKEHLESLEMGKEQILEDFRKVFELCKSPLKYYATATREEKREMLNTMTSNLEIEGKRVMISTVFPYTEISNRHFFDFCALPRDTHRTLYTKNVYSDINTSPIIFKPLKKKEAKVFFENLIGELQQQTGITSFKNINHHQSLKKHRKS